MDTILLSKISQEINERICYYKHCLFEYSQEKPVSIEEKNEYISFLARYRELVSLSIWIAEEETSLASKGN